MLQSISENLCLGAQIFEKGLSHPTFLGRAISWGIFYGAIYICVKKIYEYAVPKIKEYLDSRKCCNHTCGDTPKGEPVTPIVEHKEYTPKRQDSQPGETSLMPDSNNHTSFIKPVNISGESIKKK